MGVSVDGTGLFFGDGASLESVTGVAGPVLLAATVPDLSRGDVLAGRYQIEAAIGTGGSGRVLRAFDRVTRSPVALKILRSEFAADPVWTERFSRELRVGRQIQHPNVCRVYDIGEADGHRFLSMELATGGTLRSQMEPGAKPRSVDDRIADARAIIQGVAALHSASIVHRDLKPENILRTDDGRLLVSDFGLATDPGAGPATTVMIGTPRYMAPEVVMGDPATARSDVWALGVVMHEILSGERPNRSIIKRRRRMYTPPEVGSLRERRLVELCARCSEEDPAERPASAVELRREFEAAAAGRRFGNRLLKQQVAWGAVALATIASLGLIRNRWTSSAVASSSSVASAVGSRPVRPVGTPSDWGARAHEVARFGGAVHCFSFDKHSNRASVVWGEPRRADDLEINTGKRSPSKLLRETFETGCPQLSADGQSLLFERKSESGQQIYLSANPTGHSARHLVRGSKPEWLKNGQEFSFALDSRHVALFSVPTGELTVVTDDLRGPFAADDRAISANGDRLAVLYTTETFGSLLIVHSLPSLDVVGRLSVPAWARDLSFTASGDIRFTAMGASGVRELIAATISSGELRNVAKVPGADIRGVAPTAGGQLLLTRTLRFDLDRADTGTRLTTDGKSVNGSMAGSGMLAIQRRLPDAREVIVLRDARGHEQQITDGPTDVAPAFFPDGQRWVHTNLPAAQLVSCSTASKRCTPIHTDPLMPTFPTPSPDGRVVAYVTSLNAPRIRIVSEGRMTDLGPTQPCPPIWASTNRLWVVSAEAGGQLSWAEIDVPNARRTGALRTSNARSAEECTPPAGLADAANPTTRVVGVIQEQSTLSLLQPDAATR